MDLVALAKKYGFLVISDFAYADICYDGYQAPSFLATPGAIDVGVELTTMSKGYSMAGWRIGFCCGNSEMVRALGTIKGYYDYGIFQAIQISAIVAMRHGDESIERLCVEYQHRRDSLVDGLNRQGWDIEAPKAGMFVWAKIPEPWSEMGSLSFAMKLLNEAGVAVSPGRGFGEEGKASCVWPSSKTLNVSAKPSEKSVAASNPNRLLFEWRNRIRERLASPRVIRYTPRLIHRRPCA